MQPTSKSPHSISVERIIHDERGSAVSVLITVLLVASVALFMVFAVFGQIVGPNEIGIRKNYIGIPGLMKDGFVDEGLLPGLHWKFPAVSTVILLPRDFQFVNLNDKPEGGELDRRELEIPTTDGSKVRTDLTLVTRFYSEPSDVEEPHQSYAIPEEGKGVPIVHYAKRKHGGPGQLVNKYGTNPTRRLELIMKQAEDYLKSSLSTLSTTDYYNPVLRETAALRANEAANNAINPDGVELWGTLIRRYFYSEKNIDDQIFAKNLQEQTERLNAARRQLEEAKAETKDKIAEWDAKIMDLKVRAEQEKDVIKSEADRYEVEQISKGDRLVQEAIAKVDKAKNLVLTETPGAEVYVARQMTPLLKTLEGGVVTDIDPFDIDAWVKKLITIR